MQNRKLSVPLAILLGQLFVNGGVIIVMVGVWILTTVVLVQAKLNIWILLVGFFAGPIIAWPWWSFSKPLWENWAIRHLDETDIEEFYQAAVQAKLAWPRGHIFEKTEFKSTKRKKSSYQQRNS